MRLAFDPFDLKGQLPFSQGYAIAAIDRRTAGTLVAAGQNSGPSELPGTLLYIKKTYSAGEVKASESVWHDDGLELACLWKRVDNGPWQRRSNGEWQDAEVTCVLTA